jgi:adiponectin receptor
MGKEEEDRLALFDYGGIAVLIMGSSYPPIFYAFACQPVFGTRDMFLIIITASSTFAFGVLFNKTLASGACRAFRGVLFGVLGISAIAPLIYLDNIR